MASTGSTPGASGQLASSTALSLFWFQRCSSTSRSDASRTRRKQFSMDTSCMNPLRIDSKRRNLRASAGGRASTRYSAIAPLWIPRSSSDADSAYWRERCDITPSAVIGLALGVVVAWKLARLFGKVAPDKARALVQGGARLIDVRSAESTLRVISPARSTFPLASSPRGLPRLAK